MLLNSILLPIDGSAASLQAVETALALATASGAKLIAESVVDSNALWEVISTSPAGLVGSGPYLSAREALSNALRSASEALLLSFEVRANAYDVDSEVVIDEGNLISEIINRATEHDLVILGHNRHRKHEPLADEYVTRHSVSERVSKLCPKPLLLVQEKAYGWEHARLVVNKATAVKETIDTFLSLTSAFGLAAEIYAVCPDCEQGEMAREIAKLVDNRQRVRIITREWNECDGAWECAQDVHDNTLLVVSTEEKGGNRQTCGNSELYDLVRDLHTSAVLIMPPQPAPVLR